MPSKNKDKSQPKNKNQNPFAIFPKISKNPPKPQSPRSSEISDVLQSTIAQIPDSVNPTEQPTVSSIEMAAETPNMEVDPPALPQPSGSRQRPQPLAAQAINDPVFVTSQVRSKVTVVTDESDKLGGIADYDRKAAANKSSFAPTGSGMTWFNDTDLSNCVYNVPDLHTGITVEDVIKLVRLCTTPYSDAAQCALVGDLLLEIAFSYATLDGVRAFANPGNEPFKVKSATPFISSVLASLNNSGAPQVEKMGATLDSVLATFQTHVNPNADNSWVAELKADPNSHAVFGWWATSILRLTTKAKENYVNYHTAGASGLSRFQEHMVNFKPSSVPTAPLFPIIPDDTLTHIKASFGKANGTVFFMIARACGVMNVAKDTDISGILRGTFMITVMYAYLAGYTMFIKATASARVNPMDLLRDIKTTAMSSEVFRMHRFLYTYVGTAQDYEKWVGKSLFEKTNSIYYPIARVLNINSLNVMGRQHSPYLTYIGFTLYNQTCSEKDRINTTDYTPPSIGAAAEMLDVYVAEWLTRYTGTSGLLSGRSTIMADYDHKLAMATHKKARRMVHFQDPITDTGPEDTSNFTLN